MGPRYDRWALPPVLYLAGCSVHRGLLWRHWPNHSINSDQKTHPNTRFAQDKLIEVQSKTHEMFNTILPTTNVDRNRYSQPISSLSPTMGRLSSTMGRLNMGSKRRSQSANGTEVNDSKRHTLVRASLTISQASEPANFVGMWIITSSSGRRTRML